jgi:aryl-phospho-beta-D-glucosidase BglC (GH1 family)
MMPPMKQKAMPAVLALAVLILIIFSIYTYLRAAREYNASILEIHTLSETIGTLSEANNTLNETIDTLNETIDELTDIGNGVRRHGQLRVAGTNLVDMYGEPVQLRGFSSHGLAWYPEYVNGRAMETIKGRGANLFRAAMYTNDTNGGYNENERSKRMAGNLLYLTVENVLSADMYCLADWHILRDNNPLIYAEESAEFFDKLSARYANEPGVIYEICNEPNGDTPWDDIKAYANRIIPIIRKNAPLSIIIVGTPKYSTDIMSVSEDPLDFENIMYAYHLYTGHSKGYYHKMLDTVREKGIPVFVTEWGINADQETGILDTKEALEFIAYMEEHGISWAYWSLSNKADDDHAVIDGESVKLSGWDDEDLTIPGKIVFNALSGED